MHVCIPVILISPFAAPEDFQEITSRTLSFSPSNNREVFAVQINPDAIVENDEEFRAVISVQPGEDSVMLSPAQTTIEIADDDSKLRGY
jgi:hypothetical protein